LKNFLDLQNKNRMYLKKKCMALKAMMKIMAVGKKERKKL
jgi:hypothetical protein